LGMTERRRRIAPQGAPHPSLPTTAQESGGIFWSHARRP